MSINKAVQDDRANRDPITGAPGAHPLGTGVGAALGGVAAGALTGTVAGPIGTVIGAVVGAVAGGLAGKDVAEVVDPTDEHAYWRDNYSTRPYVEKGASYSDYGPAYAFGADSYARYAGRRFDDVEANIAREWEGTRGNSTLTWERAKHAVRDAWNRASDTVENAVPGDSDNDGR